MDRKSIIVLVASVAALMLLPFLTSRLFPPIPVGRSTNTVALATNQAVAHTNVTAIPPTNVAAVPAVTTNLVTANAPEELLVLENKNARYTFTSHGGGLKLVELLKYQESTCGGKTNATSRKTATLNTRAPIPIGGCWAATASKATAFSS